MVLRLSLVFPDYAPSAVARGSATGCKRSLATRNETTGDMRS